MTSARACGTFPPEPAATSAQPPSLWRAAKLIFNAVIHAILGAIRLGRLLAMASRIQKRITEPPRKRQIQPLPALT